ncbi:Serine phosphatase RsbU, regulator of sigma subunit [Ekhidna lutea]|uniref:Serine phosphatase RsbU, regulator of sigma subunit n=1 Tax=Ekhidna lutea TaxID=447679 RepID=A0A239LJC0_EKHLU|nr:SpoIIE family protein phosphatase [Ekhidna lutea]SNT30465.1 Serine phosphatase RsbU, regulator of sigma subunit [Ekhidna lutea]
MNIYAKLTILCLFLVLFTAGVLSFFADQKVEQTLKEEIVRSMTQQSKGISSDIGRFMYSRLNDVRMAARNLYFTNPNADPEILTQRLQELEDINNLYYSFSYFDMNRVRIADSKRISIGRQHPNSLYWTKLGPEQNETVDVSKSESVGRVIMHFASKVKASDNSDIGVLVGRILVDELFKIVDEYTLSSDTTRTLDIHLIDGAGTVLYSNIDPSNILNTQYEQFELISSLNEPGVNFLETQDALYFVTRETNYLSFTGNDWALILSVPKERAYAPLSQIREQILWAVLPVLALTIILALIAANFFVKPIVKLSLAAEELSKGNLDVELPIGSKDEIGKLAKQMANTSQSLIGQIEEQRQTNKQLIDQKTQIEMQKNQLVSVSSQIRDSISYAERIQRSTLPPISTLRSIFPESFVMYRPKDIIGGDFYWFERVRRGNNEFMIVACGDCTGHGVPGAIMSIMGSNQLTNIVYYQNYLDPKKIISRLDKVIKFELQRETDEVNRDGMEIGICVIDLDTLKMEYAGAGIPLRLMKHGDDKLTIYKTPRMMVGGIEGDEQEVHAQLVKEVIQLDAKDRIFLSSDGYQDQFGGENDKKFMSKNFHKLIEESSDKPLLEQQKIIEKTFSEWSKNTSQTDDVCVLGFEVK